MLIHSTTKNEEGKVRGKIRMLDIQGGTLPSIFNLAILNKSDFSIVKSTEY